MIPKIIHQTWKTERLPAWARRLYASWSTHNPDYQHWLWTDQDLRALIETDFPWFLDTYDSFPLTIQRVDAARYFILYKYGGVYADLDFECYKSLDDFTESDDSIILSKSSNIGSVVTNALMMSAPGQEFWLHLARRIQREPPRRALETKAYYVLRSTGPLAVHRAAREFGLWKDDHGARVLPKRFFFPFTMFEVGKQRNSQWKAPRDAYGAHHHMCTWTDQHHHVINAGCAIAVIVAVIVLGVVGAKGVARMRAAR